MATVQIGIGELAVVQPGDQVATVGLGSCCGVVIYDPVSHISGMIHVMLPDYTAIRSSNLNLARFADTGIPLLLEELRRKGAGLKLLAKMAGGAQMFSLGGGVMNERMMVGTNNVNACRKVLAAQRIPLLAEDVLGTMGRSITFNPETMMLQVRTVGRGEKYI